jgi:hypothetical protein
MSIELVLKAGLIWLVMAVFAMANGIFRDKILAPWIAEKNALPLSGIILSVLIILLSYLSIPFFGQQNASTFIFIGLLWLSMTLFFEFIFGHFILGKTWGEISQVFHILEGNLFIVALLATATGPYLAAWLRGILD